MAEEIFRLKAAFDIDQDELPGRIRTALRRRWHYPKELAVSDDAHLAYRMGRAHSVACSKRAVVRRQMLGWMVSDGRPIGAIAATTYDVRCHNNRAMIDIMDLEYGEEYELATALASGWEVVGLDVCRYGPILYFNAAWIDRKYRGGDLLRRCVDAIAGEVFPEFSVAVVRTPAGEVAEGMGSRTRQAAMRYYGTLGARAFPGRAGQEGWMWAPHPESRWLKEPNAIRWVTL